MWEVTLITQQSKPAVNNILSLTTKPELTQHFHTAPFIPTAKILLKETKKGFLKKWTDLIEGLIKKHIEKLADKTMVHLNRK